MSWVLDLSILSIFVCIRVYICSADYVGLPALLYLLQCLVYHMLQNEKLWNLHTYKVIREELVLGLLVRFRTAVVCEPGKM